MSLASLTAKISVSAVALMAAAVPALGHPGGRNSQGCHGGSVPYHCHEKKPVKKPISSTGYERENWDYNSRTARRRLGCARSEHVDHIVALKEAYDSGASAWGAEKKERFANDPVNQMCLDGRLNMSKSDGDLAEWDGGDCELRKTIAMKSIEVKVLYGLEIDPAEWRANAEAILDDCDLG